MNKLFVFIGMTSLLLLSSCAKEDEVNPSDPTDDRSKYTGTWAVEENSKEFGASTYNVTVTNAATSTSDIMIAYLYGLKKETVATVNQNKLFISNQIIDGVKVAGSGVLENSKRISLKYTVQITKTKYDTITAILKK